MAKKKKPAKKPKRKKLPKKKPEDSNVIAYRVLQATIRESEKQDHYQN